MSRFESGRSGLPIQWLSKKGTVLPAAPVNIDPCVLASRHETITGKGWEAFAKIKGIVRQAVARTKDALVEALDEALSAISA
jgi:hypothetical protein